MKIICLKVVFLFKVSVDLGIYTELPELTFRNWRTSFKVLRGNECLQLLFPTKTEIVVEVLLSP